MNDYDLSEEIDGITAEGYTYNKRCGKCKNCIELERVKASVLKAVNPPFSHADQGVVDLWNKEVERLPCLEEKR